MVKREFVNSTVKRIIFVMSRVHSRYALVTSRRSRVMGKLLVAEEARLALGSVIDKVILQVFFARKYLVAFGAIKVRETAYACLASGSSVTLVPLLRSKEVLRIPDAALGAVSKQHDDDFGKYE